MWGNRLNISDDKLYILKTKLFFSHTIGLIQPISPQLSTESNLLTIV